MTEIVSLVVRTYSLLKKKSVARRGCKVVENPRVTRIKEDLFYFNFIRILIKEYSFENFKSHFCVEEE